MSANRFVGWDAELFDLAADAQTVGLEPEARAELERRADPAELAAFEHAVAALHRAALGSLEELPSDLAQRLQAASANHGTPPRPVPLVFAARRQSLLVATLAGWAAAAGLLFWALTARVPREHSPAGDRDALLARADDLVRADFRPTEDPLAGTLTGDVVWSGSSQEGYLHFQGLAPNDPAEHQYQLWIFDSSREDWEQQPVDGGVFDVRGEDTVVPIAAKLPVRQAALFAVTLEAPGGVVVSKREHLLALAQP